MGILKGLNVKKKWIIASGIVVFIVGLFVLLAFTLFSLRSIKVDYRTSTLNLTATEQEIIDSADFKMNTSVLFHGKKGYINKIENAFPYIKVVNIETVFPSRFVVHVAEREAIYALKGESGYLICDDEFKILEIEKTFQNDAILLSGVSYKGIEKEGEFLNVENFPLIYSYLYENGVRTQDAIALINEITFGTKYDNILGLDLPYFSMSMTNGQTYTILNCSYGLQSKIGLFKELYGQIFNYIGQTLTLVDENNQSYQVTLTYNNLKNAEIVINNYYDYKSYDENDCYFKLQIKDETKSCLIIS